MPASEPLTIAPQSEPLILVPVGPQAKYRKPVRVQLREIDNLNVWLSPDRGSSDHPEFVYQVHFVWVGRKTISRRLRQPYDVSRCQFRALILAGVPISSARASVDSRFFHACMREEEPHRRVDLAQVLDQVPAIAGEEWSEVTWALAKEILEELLTRAKVGRLFADRLRRRLVEAYHFAAEYPAERCRQARWVLQGAHDWVWGKEQWERRGSEWK